MDSVCVHSSKNYDVEIGSGLLDTCGEEISKVTKSKHCALISDSNVDLIYGERVLKSLKEAGFTVHKFVFPSGEKYKTTKTYIDILEFLADMSFDRQDSIIALGGGVASDMAGYAAATYMRGISLINIPTTLLAMVDASIGGKTAINLGAHKNLVGAFWQPNLVLCDIEVLSTLSAKIFADGCAEVIKYAILDDPEILDLMQDMHSNIEEIITRCIKIKKKYTEEDERETGSRVMLNLGHSIGHAFEVLSEYKVTHGRAVSIGIAGIARSAYANGECSQECVKKIVESLTKANLPTEIDYEPNELVRVMMTDKKRDGDSIKLIIPREIGRCEIRETPYSELANYIASGY